MQQGIVAVLIGLLVGASLSWPARSLAQDDVNVYTSPTFGYVLAYGDEWDVLIQDSRDGRDRVVLSNQVSDITMTGSTTFGDNAEECVAFYEESLARRSDTASVEVATAPDGELLRGSAGNRAFAIYQFDLMMTLGTVPTTVLIACIPLASPGATLAVTHSAAAEQFNAEIAAREALIGGLALTPAGAEATTTEEVSPGEAADTSDPTAAYLSTITGQRETVAFAFDTARSLLVNAGSLDQTQRSQLLVSFAIFRVNADDAATLVPPTELVGLHEQHVDSLETLASAGELYVSGMDTNDQVQFAQALELLQQGAVLFQAVGDELDILD